MVIGATQGGRDEDQRGGREGGCGDRGGAVQFFPGGLVSVGPAPLHGVQQGRA